MYANWRLALLVSVILLGFGCKKNRNSGLIIPGDGSDTLVIQPPEPEFYAQNPVHIAVGSNIGGFYEALPPGYDSTSAKKYPLLLFLHGGGERGDGDAELSLITRNGLTKLLDKKKFPNSFTVNGEQFSFIIISPQFKVWPRVGDIKKLIDYALENYEIDPKRIYLAGLSMGGGATWEYAAQHGSELAAIVPICGASTPTEAITTKLALTGVPTWAFHNKDDNVVSVNSTIGYIDLIKAANPLFPYKLTLWETGGHDSWTKATDPNTKEDGKNIYEWMLQYKR